MNPLASVISLFRLLGENQLTGTVPVEFPMLKYHLNDNRLTGTLSSESFENKPQFSDLYASTTVILFIHFSQRPEK